MKYNIYISNNLKSMSILDISENVVIKITEGYKNNKEFIFINGEKLYLGELLEIQIYEFNNPQFSSGEHLYKYCEDNYFLENQIFEPSFIPKKILSKIGNNVTDQFVKDEDLEPLTKFQIKEDYINNLRIKQLEDVNHNKKYDLSRLIEVLKEINICYKNDLKYSIPPLIRSIIDQVPPIFDKNNFSEVCSSYGTRSFKDSMNILDKNSRKIADSYLHTQIRQKEHIHPTDTQINFKNELDVLLQEIIRII